MPPRPSVCVLMSTYNGQAFLEPQIASLAAQEGVEVRLHVRDDGSTDDTLTLLRSYAETAPFSIALDGGGPNVGPAASFLQLLAAAPDDADYYAFCDQDDVWLPGKLARAVEALSADVGPALYCSNVTCVDDRLAVLGTPRENGDARLQHLLFENIAYGCTTVMNRASRTLIVARLPERGVVMHDWWCALVVAALGEVRYDPQPQILYRQHGANSVGTDANPIRRLALQARKFLRSPAAFYPIYAQAAELNRLYGQEVYGEQSRALNRLLGSRRSLGARVSLALSRDIVRTRQLDGLIVRGLILADWH